MVFYLYVHVIILCQMYLVCFLVSICDSVHDVETVSCIWSQHIIVMSEI